jgi:3,4-dihydroxy 2-butanone 4-phosphate synthase / GTP cyclohydrolase II
VLMRSGHTEAAVDLCVLSGLPPVGVICELVNDDGTVTKGKQVADFAAKHNLKHVTIADMIAWRQAREKLVERVSSFDVETPIGPMQGYAYKTLFDEVYHLAFVFGSIGNGQRVLTRFHKPNILTDIFAASPKIGQALVRFKKEGSGVLVCLRDGAVGVPLTPLAQESSTDSQRNERWREFGVGAQILRDLGVTSINNLTTSSRSYPGLVGFGIEIADTEILG